MTAATHTYRNRISFVFDFDLTLAPGSLEPVLAMHDLEYAEFEREHVGPLVEEGWDKILAKVFCLVRLSRSGKGPKITRELLEDTGRRLQPFPGVPEMFDRLRGVVAEVDPDIQTEFFLISSGLVDVMRATCIAHEFEHLWGTELHFDEAGEVAFVKQIVTHPEKERYLLALAKGLDPDGEDGPADIYREVSEEDMHVPLDQVIYVGDGASDMPVFRLMNERGGIALGVFKSEAESWEGRDSMHAGRRVQNLARAEYGEDSELMRSLKLAAQGVTHLMRLKRLSQGE